jgi:hypothetical protein
LAPCIASLSAADSICAGVGGGRTFPIFAVVDVVNLEYLRKVLWSNVCDCGLAVKMRDFVEKEQEGKSEKRRNSLV